MSCTFKLLFYFLTLDGKNKVTALVFKMIFAKHVDKCLNASILFSSDVFFFFSGYFRVYKRFEFCLGMLILLCIGMWKENYVTVFLLD